MHKCHHKEINYFYCKSKLKELNQKGGDSCRIQTIHYLCHKVRIMTKIKVWFELPSSARDKGLLGKFSSAYAVSSIAYVMVEFRDAYPKISGFI
ncbi:hypothetical protein H5410_019838, partial [Solanum commersonii]